MSQLIQMRHRIKAIETIKKITHAMRLIAMSSHSQLKNKESNIQTYKQTIHTLFNKVQVVAQQNPNRLFAAENQFSAKVPEDTKPLLILISSHKGLCGSFNTILFHFFETQMAQHNWQNPSIIAVGKKAVEYSTAKKIGPLIAAYDELTISTHTSIAQQITAMIISKGSSYTSVRIFSNKLKNFFIQKPEATLLLPFERMETDSSKAQPVLEDYIWEIPPRDVLTFITQQYIEASLQFFLFQSLLSEHAARFLSMDNATRNAQNLLEKTKLDYFKLRQAKITKELTELVGSFQI